MTQTATREVPAAPSHRTRHGLGLGLAFSIGILVALQSRVNGQLGHDLGDGVAAVLISFASGGVLLLLAVALVAKVRHGLGRVWCTVRNPAGGLRWYHCIGGLAGAFLVASQSITVTTLGVAVFTVAVVAGQAASALLVDRHGLGPAGVQPITLLRLVGAATALVAVLLAVSDRLSHPNGLVLALLPAIGGCATAVQQAMNGRVAWVAAPDPSGAVSAAVINFVVGNVALVIVLIADLAIRGLPQALPSNPWLYVGGACGVAFITLAAAIVRMVGVFVLGLGTIAGQLAGSLLLDLTVPAANGAVTASVVAGTTLAFAAVVVTALPGLRR